MSYFAIERNGQCWSPVVLQSKNGDSDFSSFLNMTYDEMKNSEHLEEFVVASMEATNEASSTGDDQTIVTLIDKDDVFVWSIIMGSGDNDDIRYSLVDWKKDGHMYRYVPENNS